MAVDALADEGIILTRSRHLASTFRERMTEEQTFTKPNKYRSSFWRKVLDVVSFGWIVCTFRVELILLQV